MANLKNTTIGNGSGSFSATNLHGNADTATKILDESLGSQIALTSLDIGFYKYDPITAGNIEFTDLTDDLKNKPFYLEVYPDCFGSTLKTLFLYINNSIKVFDNETGVIDTLDNAPLTYIGHSENSTKYLQGYACIHLHALEHGHYQINGFSMADAEMYSITARNIADGTQLLINDSIILSKGDSVEFPKGTHVKVYAQAVNPDGNYDVVMNMEQDTTPTENTSSNAEMLFFVEPGTLITLDLVPDDYYKSTAFTVNGDQVPDRYSFTAKDRYEINAVLVQNETSVNFTQPEGATIHVSVDGVDHTESFTSLAGKEAIITIEANEAYNITSIMFNGETINSGDTVVLVEGANSVTCTTAIKRFNVNITQPTGGTIAATVVGGDQYTNTFTVDYGTQVKFEVTPETGYALTKLMYGNTEIANGSTMTITNTINITAQLTLNSYTVHITQPEHGEIIVNAAGVNHTTDFTAAHGTTLNVTVTTDTGYQINAFTYNGQIITSPYNTTLTGETTIICTTKPISYTINIPTIDHATISVTYDGSAHTSSFEGEYGKNITINVSPENGYKITNITVNGSPISNGASVTITGEMNIQVELDLNAFAVNVTPDPEKNGSIEYKVHVKYNNQDYVNPQNDELMVIYGESVEISMEEQTGFTNTELFYVMGTANEALDISTTNTVSITGTMIISASMERKLYKLQLPNNLKVSTVNISGISDKPTDHLPENYNFDNNVTRYRTITAGNIADGTTLYVNDQEIPAGETVLVEDGSEVNIYAKATDSSRQNDVVLNVTDNLENAELVAVYEYPYNTTVGIAFSAGTGVRISVYNNDTLLADLVTSGSTGILMNEDHIITATESAIMYTIGVRGNENSTLTFTPVDTVGQDLGVDDVITINNASSPIAIQNASLTYGTYNLKVVPDTNYQVDSISYNSTTIVSNVTSSTTRQITVHEDGTMIVNDSIRSYSLQVTKPDSVDMTINGTSVSTNTYYYDANTALEIRVQPKSNYEISSVKWNNSELTATEEIMLRTVNITQPENGRIEFSCAEAGLNKEVGSQFTLLDGMQYTAELVANDGYVANALYVEPSADQSSKVGAYVYNVNITQNSTLVVDAELRKFSFSLSNNSLSHDEINVNATWDNGNLSVLPGGVNSKSIEIGTKVTLTVTSNNADIVNVYLDGEELEPITSKVNRILTIAQPANGQIQVTCAAAGLTNAVGTRFEIPDGSQVTINAVPNSGYTVDSLDVSPSSPQTAGTFNSATYEIIMNSNHSVEVSVPKT